VAHIFGIACREKIDGSTVSRRTFFCVRHDHAIGLGATHRSPVLIMEVIIVTKSGTVATKTPARKDAKISLPTEIPTDPSRAVVQTIIVRLRLKTG
jgi:hypothetical protein